ncbi:MAG: exosortase system-associated protein, TIGR04073 family [Chthoniobacterales bacterium]
MKLFICSLLLVASFGMARADIQDPPGKKYDGRRKFDRGVANILYGTAELPHTICVVNNEEGNSAAFSVGILSGLRRSAQRMGVGVFEVLTHPFPLNRGTYKPYLKSPTRNHNGTFGEFPPELGFESSYGYARH